MEHIGKASRKASMGTAVLAKIMANIGGSSQSRRTLLAKVSQSSLMYAALIWGKALMQKAYSKKMEIVSRVSAFKTVLYEAVSVISVNAPPDKMACKLSRIYGKAKRLNR